MEDNKLIAEFDGWKLSSDGITYMNPQDKDDCWITEEMKYHTSWDWLMPVVERIKDIEYTRRGYDDEMDKIDNVLTCDLRIENLYKAVVEFIKEYNK